MGLGFTGSATGCTRIIIHVRGELNSPAGFEPGLGFGSAHPPRMRGWTKIRE